MCACIHTQLYGLTKCCLVESVESFLSVKLSLLQLISKSHGIFLILEIEMEAFGFKLSTLEHWLAHRLNCSTLDRSATTARLEARILILHK